MQIYILQKFYFLIFYKIKKCNFAKIIKNKITDEAFLFETLNKPLPAQLAKVIVEYLKLNKRQNKAKQRQYHNNPVEGKLRFPSVKIRYK